MTCPHKKNQSSQPNFFVRLLLSMRDKTFKSRRRSGLDGEIITQRKLRFAVISALQGGLDVPTIVSLAITDWKMMQKEEMNQ